MCSNNVLSIVLYMSDCLTLELNFSKKHLNRKSGVHGSGALILVGVIFIFKKSIVLIMTLYTFCFLDLWLW